ncbi:MAG TPA: tetratricopeptide repeat protein [Bryobacteraceae bacterium]|jgi:protein O-GlcNAc transferase
MTASTMIDTPVATASEKSASEKSISGLAYAVIAHLKGDAAAALGSLDSGIASEKEIPETLAARAHLLAELKKYDEAVGEYEKLLARRPHYAEGHYQCGACLYHLGRYEDALPYFARSAELDPTHVDTFLVQGICQLHLKRSEEALQSFAKCLEKLPNLEAALLGKGVALQLAWEFDEAVEVYRQVLRRNPDCEEAAVNLIALGMQRKDYALVRHHGQALLARDASAQAALEGLATAAFAEGTYEEAAGHYCRLVELYPRNFDYWFNLGVTYHRIGKLLDSAAAYQNAASLRPDATAAHINLAAVYHEMGDLQGSRHALDCALAVAPERTDLRYQRAVVVEEQGLADEAEPMYADLADRDAPEREDAQFRLGYLKLQRDDYAGAADCLRACLQKRPEWSAAELNLALAYWKLGQYSQSQDVLLELLRREPGNVEAVRGMSANALEQKDTSNALRWHLCLQELGDRSPEVLQNTAILYQQSGDVDSAIRTYREAIAVKPDFAEALLNLGHALEAAGDHKNARDSWVRALELKPELARGYFLSRD